MGGGAIQEIVIGMNFIFVDFIDVNSCDSLTNLIKPVGFYEKVCDSPEFTHR